MVSVPLLTERMGVNYFEENLLELYLQVGIGSYQPFQRLANGAPVKQVLPTIYSLDISSWVYQVPFPG